MAWSYNREESSNFELIPEGKHRIRVRSAEKSVSKSGNDMLVLQFDVSGYTSRLYHYITFMADKPEVTNRLLTQFFDSFKDIPEGDLNTAHWIGKVGACTIKHEEYNGSMTAKIGYFIKAERQYEILPWTEPSGSGTVGSGAGNNSGGNDFLNVPDNLVEELPF